MIQEEIISGKPENSIPITSSPIETPGINPKEKPEVEPDVLPDEEPGIQPGKIYAVQSLILVKTGEYIGLFPGRNIEVLLNALAANLFHHALHW